VNLFGTPSGERALQVPNRSHPGPTSVRPGWPLIGIEDYQVALVTFRAACERWPGTPITLRQGGASSRIAGVCAWFRRAIWRFDSHFRGGGQNGTRTVQILRDDGGLGMIGIGQGLRLLLLILGKGVTVP
jgi:hypothetical protein